MRKTRTLTLVLFLLGSACGAESHEAMLPYKANETEIIGGNDFHNATDPQSRPPSDGFGAISVATPDGDECAELDGVCVNPQMTCGDDGRADVLIDENGAVVDVTAIRPAVSRSRSTRGLSQMWATTSCSCSTPATTEWT